MADLVPCTGRSEAPAARTWGRAFVFIPAVFCGACRAGRGVPRGRRPEGMREGRLFCAARPCPAGLGEKAVRDAGTFAGGGACLGGVWDEVTEEFFPAFRT